MSSENWCGGQLGGRLFSPGFDNFLELEALNGGRDDYVKTLARVFLIRTPLTEVLSIIEGLTMTLALCMTLL